MRALTAREQRLILDTVDRQLLHQAAVETRQRKPMRPNPLAPWELRIGDLRVYYVIEETPTPRVLVRAVGRKVRERILIAGEEVRL